MEPCFALMGYDAERIAASVARDFTIPYTTATVKRAFPVDHPENTNKTKGHRPGDKGVPVQGAEIQICCMCGSKFFSKHSDQVCCNRMCAGALRAKKLREKRQNAREAGEAFNAVMEKGR